ncbi:hypothetical protein [Shewanella gelidii]|uniref:Porin n=1 Tax=Shewanella gelidii TaxID=1642821 RepID=A0A917JRM0_9GAMM|nr:hypothetical protein [Shewanella gelidii]MCL1097848.1 hypothetical protein [Shewanella gelidii]GGI78285.1 hypothetical protein GCM10009332_14580 [Shewanella gelidii]
MFGSSKKYLHGAVLIWFVSPAVNASEWQFNGFISQGYATAEDSQFVVGKSGDTANITEASITSSWKINDNYRMAGALNFRQWGELAEADVDFDYLFAEYTRNVNSSLYGARLGRFKNEFGFYSSTRDVPFTRPSIMLPQSIYADYFRDTQLHIDGIDLFGSHALNSGVIHWHTSYGQITVTDDLLRNVNGSVDSGEYDSQEFYALDIDYQMDNARLGVSYYRAGVDFSPIAPALYSEGDIVQHTWVFSGQYRYEMFELTTEYLTSDRAINQIIYPELLGEVESRSSGFYADIRAYLPYQLEAFVRYDQHYDDIDDKNGANLELTTGDPRYYAYTYDWTVGLRWFPDSNWMVAAEYHDVKGASWVTPLLVRDPTSQAKRWSLFALQLSYRF